MAAPLAAFPLPPPLAPFPLPPPITYLFSILLHTKEFWAAMHGSLEQAATQQWRCSNQRHKKLQPVNGGGAATSDGELQPNGDDDFCCHRRQILNLESSGEGMTIGEARKAGRGHLEEKGIIHPMLVRQPRWWTVVGISDVCTWIYYSGWHDMVVSE